MNARWSRVGALCGLLLALAWAPMGLVVGELPDLDSAAEVDGFFSENGDQLKIVIASVSVGFAFFLFYLGSLVERLRGDGDSAALRNVVLAGAIMFMTLFNAALGIDAAAGLIQENARPELVHGLHSAAFALAAPAAFVGVAFFVALALLAFSVHAISLPLGWLALAGALANVGAIGGIFADAGPLNSGNGAIAGIAVPVLAWVVWIGAESVATLRSSRAPGVRRGGGRLGDAAARESLGGLWFRPPPPS